jgi:hypothetical protein
MRGLWEEIDIECCRENSVINFSKGASKNRERAAQARSLSMRLGLALSI